MENFILVVAEFVLVVLLIPVDVDDDTTISFPNIANCE